MFYKKFRHQKSHDVPPMLLLIGKVHPITCCTQQPLLHDNIKLSSRSIGKNINGIGQQTRFGNLPCQFIAEPAGTILPTAMIIYWIMNIIIITLYLCDSRYILCYAFPSDLLVLNIFLPYIALFCYFSYLLLR